MEEIPLLERICQRSAVVMRRERSACGLECVTGLKDLALIVLALRATCRLASVLDSGNGNGQESPNDSNNDQYLKHRDSAASRFEAMIGFCKTAFRHR